MTTFDDLVTAHDELDAIVTDVLGSILGEEAVPAHHAMPDGPVASARLCKLDPRRIDHEP